MIVVKESKKYPRKLIRNLADHVTSIYQGRFFPKGKTLGTRVNESNVQNTR